MRKLLLLLVAGLAVFIAFNRMRLFLWDPLASVTRNGVTDPEARARINYANDVLLEDHSRGLYRMYLVQHAWGVPLAPAVLKCLGRPVCLTDADRATGTPIGAAEPASMTDRVIRFKDEDGKAVEVRLR